MDEESRIDFLRSYHDHLPIHSLFKLFIFQGDFENGVIRVQAPHLTKSCVAIRLDPSMVAGDIVNRFRKTSTNARYKHYNIKCKHFV